MKAMILAAGLGQRMRPLTDHTPKPLLPAGGKPLLVYHLEKLAQLGVSQVIINLAYLGEKIRTYVGDGSGFGLKVDYSQEPEPLETGGALLQAMPLLGDAPFLLLNGDVWCDLDLRQLIGPPLAQDQLGRLLLVPNPDFHPRGDFAINDQGIILGEAQGDTIKPQSDNLQSDNPQRFTYAGIALLKPTLVADYPHKRRKFPLVEAFRYAIARHQLTGQLHTGHWSDVGTPERLTELDTFLRR